MTALSKQQIVETLGPSGHLWGLLTVNYIAPTIERTLSETEQRGRPGRATKARRDHESLYSSLFAHAPVMMHAIDRTERLIAVNDAWVSRMGYEQDEVIGRKSASFLTKASRAYAKSTALPRFFETGEARDVPFTFVKKNGETMNVLLTGVLIRDSGGAVIHSIAAMIDVTAGSRVEEQRIFGRGLEHLPGIRLSQSSISDVLTRFDTLTQREVQVMELLVNGMSNNKWARNSELVQRRLMYTVSD